ncbi:uncharacterized protein BX664DRAFT_269514 [Halteromyces radiatus]|uniref:uncharacterized protein n=1 Tax=Halteromyces radiatus TaxID=101107 RepID=UPI00221E3EDB|nr:uncharacterized protein BX664DRAFT_269514 [Halteromyces radiatus]KAI8079958.1 hypothetical protein BX664DRAFT_269514 [Halteromyces radiatus]
MPKEFFTVGCFKLLFQKGGKESALDVPVGTYTAADSIFVDSTECDILYMSRSANLASLPAVIVEIQHTMICNLMCQAVQFYLNVYKRFHTFPILFIVCISKAESKALDDLFKSSKTRFIYWKHLVSTSQKNCFMLTKESIDPFIDNRDINVLDLLIAFAHFLTSGQQSIISIDRWDDPSVTRLYLVDMKMVKNDRETETDKMEALRTICQTTQSQFEKILSTNCRQPPAERKLTQMQDDTTARVSKGLNKLGILKKMQQELVKEEDENLFPLVINLLHGHMSYKKKKK